MQRRGTTHFDRCIRPTGGRRFGYVYEALRTRAGFSGNAQKATGCCHLMVNVTTNRGHTAPPHQPPTYACAPRPSALLPPFSGSNIIRIDLPPKSNTAYVPPFSVTCPSCPHLPHQITPRHPRIHPLFTLTYNPHPTPNHPKWVWASRQPSSTPSKIYPPSSGPSRIARRTVVFPSRMSHGG